MAALGSCASRRESEAACAICEWKMLLFLLTTSPMAFTGVAVAAQGGLPGRRWQCINGRRVSCGAELRCWSNVIMCFLATSLGGCVIGVEVHGLGRDELRFGGCVLLLGGRRHRDPHG